MHTGQPASVAAAAVAAATEAIASSDGANSGNNGGGGGGGWSDASSGGGNGGGAAGPGSAAAGAAEPAPVSSAQRRLLGWLAATGESGESASTRWNRRGFVRVRAAGVCGSPTPHGRTRDPRRAEVPAQYAWPGLVHGGVTNGAEIDAAHGAAHRRHGRPALLAQHRRIECDRYGTVAHQFPSENEAPVVNLWTSYHKKDNRGADGRRYCRSTQFNAAELPKPETVAV